MQFPLGGHSITTWTEFCHFLTPLPCVDSFYTLSVDKNRHFLTPSHPSSCPRSYWMPPYSSTHVDQIKRYVWTFYQDFAIIKCGCSHETFVCFQFWTFKMALCFAYVFNYWHFDPAIRSKTNSFLATLTINKGYVQTFRGYSSNIIWKFKKRLEKYP